MKEIIVLLMVFAAINCKAQDSEWKHPIDRANEISDSTIIGYEFISQETEYGYMSYSALNIKYNYLDMLAKADRTFYGLKHVENLFVWVDCDLDVNCFNEQFMRQVVDANRWTTRDDYKYDRYEPIFYFDFKNSYLKNILSR